jgi:hypothetical protein
VVYVFSAAVTAATTRTAPSTSTHDGRLRALRVLSARMSTLLAAASFSPSALCFLVCVFVEVDVSVYRACLGVAASAMAFGSLLVLARVSVKRVHVTLLLLRAGVRL